MTRYAELKALLGDVLAGFIPDLRQHANELHDCCPEVLDTIDEWQERLEREYAALALPEDGGWQPIESAPKDGTRIVVCGGDVETIAVVAWLDGFPSVSRRRHKPMMCWCVPESWQDEQGGYAEYCPTYWMLPATPKDVE